jgi:hypothetical protein
VPALALSGYHLRAMRRALLIVMLTVLSAAEIANSSTRSGLFGVVRIGPTAPVCVAGRSCSRPAAGVTLVFARSGREARATTARDGTYAIVLSAGTWSVRSLARGIGRTVEPKRVIVRPAQRTRANFMIDTGIR